MVVVFWGKAGWKIGPGGRPAASTAPRIYDWGGDVHGAYMTPWYAMWAQRYMHEFGVTSEDLAEVAVRHRYHATLNPASVMGRRGPLTVEDVVSSRIVSSPLHLFDCAIDTDGGLLSNTHCGIPHSLFTVEVARQLRGECGERQVPGARIGLSLAQGASVHGYAGTLIMAID